MTRPKMPLETLAAVPPDLAGVLKAEHQLVEAQRDDEHENPVPASHGAGQGGPVVPISRSSDAPSCSGRTATFAPRAWRSSTRNGSRGASREVLMGLTGGGWHW